MNINGIRQILIVVSSFTLTLIARAEPESANSSSAKLVDLPPAVQLSLREKIGSSTILQIAATPGTYCARLDANGQKSEVRISEAGNVIRVRSKQEAEAQFEVEQRLAQAGRLKTVELDTVPANVRAIITDRSKGQTIDRITKTPTIFVIRIDRDGEKIEIQLTEDGKVIGGSGK